VNTRSVAVVALFCAGSLVASAPEVQGAPADVVCSCAHESAVCVPYEQEGNSRAACVYMVNAFGPELRTLQLNDYDESQLVKAVLKPSAPGSPNRSRFFQVEPLQIEDERVSRDGVLLVRAFDDGSKSAIPMKRLNGLKLKLGTDTFALESDGAGAKAKTLALEKPLEKAKLGDTVELELVTSDAKSFRRYSWYRPRTGWVVDYSVLGLAFAWPSWSFAGQPESSIVPAMIELEHRYYKRDGGIYWFTSLGIGPNLKLTSAEKDGVDRSSDALVNGLVGAITINLNGFQVGFGSRWDWGQGRLDPMVTLSFTEALARGLGLTDKLPDSLVGGD
jgi:hypothetical protein